MTKLRWIIGVLIFGNLFQVAVIVNQRQQLADDEIAVALRDQALQVAREQIGYQQQARWAKQKKDAK